MNSDKARTKKKISNEALVGFFVFQFGILYPITVLVGSQIPVAICMVFSMLIYFFNNGMKISKWFIYISLSVFFLFLIHMLLYSIPSFVMIEGILDFTTTSIPAIFIGSVSFEPKKVYPKVRLFALVSFGSMCVGFLFKDRLPFSYMRFGYCMIPSVLVFFYEAVKARHTKWMLLFLVSFFICVVYGSRGPLVVFLIFVVFLVVSTNTFSKGRKAFLVVLLSIVAFLLLFPGVLEDMLSFLTRSLGINTYSIRKYIVMLEDGLDSTSSGRDVLTQNSISYIKERPLGGYGVYSWNSTLFLFGYGLERTYPHNIFLQLLLEGGFLLLMLWVLSWVLCLQKLNRRRKFLSPDFMAFLFLIGSISLGRLLVSSQIWVRSEYWFAFSLVANVAHSRSIQHD